MACIEQMFGERTFIEVRAILIETPGELVKSNPRSEFHGSELWRQERGHFSPKWRGHLAENSQIGPEFFLDLKIQKKLGGLGG